MHCVANNVGKTRLKRLLGIISDILSQCKEVLNLFGLVPFPGEHGVSPQIPDL